VIETRKKERKYGNERNFYVNLHQEMVKEWNSQLAETS